MEIGATFSHYHLQDLGLNAKKAIREFHKLGLEWARLGCYWNEIEKEKDKFDFKGLDKIVEYCEKKDIKVAMTLGMKAPRWPEYFIPEWASLDNLDKYGVVKANGKFLSECLSFTEKCVKNYKKHKCIKVWQIENEPFDPSGPYSLRIEEEFIKKEVELVRQLDNTRKIMVNVWGNEYFARRTHKKAQKYADIIGFDFYLRVPSPFLNKLKKYFGPVVPRWLTKRTFDSLRKNGKEAWIVELQMEPWEPGEIVSQKNNPESFLSKHFKKNLSYGKNLKPDVILLWGFEYWYWRLEKYKDQRYWSIASKEISSFLKNNK